MWLGRSHGVADAGLSPGGSQSGQLPGGPVRRSALGRMRSDPSSEASLWLLSKPFWIGSQFGVVVNSPPILEPILVGIGMFTGGTIWILTHGRLTLATSVYNVRSKHDTTPLVVPAASPFNALKLALRCKRRWRATSQKRARHSAAFKSWQNGRKRSQVEKVEA